MEESNRPEPLESLVGVSVLDNQSTTSSLAMQRGVITFSDGMG